jgi:hypothetical protein
MGQHTHLTAMMRIVRNHIDHHGSARRPLFRPTVAVKSFDPALGVGESACNHLGAACAALTQSSSYLFLRATGAVEWGRELKMWGRQPQPFAANIVNMRENRGDRPSLTPGQFRAPRRRIEMLENHLIHPFIYGVTLHQYLAKIDANVSLGSGHSHVRNSIPSGVDTTSQRPRLSHSSKFLAFAEVISGNWLAPNETEVDVS